VGKCLDHRTLAAFVSSLQGEIASLFRDILLVCAEQGLLGGTHFALEGVKLPSDEKFTAADFTYDPEQDCYRCPGGKVLKLKARRHQIENNSYRRYEAAEAIARAVRSGSNVYTPPNPAQTSGQLARASHRDALRKMSAKIDMPAAREFMAATGHCEPVLGNLRHRSAETILRCGEEQSNHPVDALLSGP